MNYQENESVISRILQTWYHIHKRDLPWRENTEAYRIWISEIILQQTRVNQGLEYFLRFMENFPDVQTLAAAPEEKVLKLWQGLGYYSRARNLHAAAKQIVSDFNGIFPNEHHNIISLKGVGEYTAAAIASIAYNQPYAVVDGNVDRVLSRLFAIPEAVNTLQGRKIIREIVSEILDSEHPGLHNQAIMDFGAMICMPAAPKCDVCPLQHHCLAFREKSVLQYPVKKKQKSARHRYFNYFHIEVGGKTYIQKRENTDIWKNLYEFPLIETKEKTDLSEPQLYSKIQRLFGKTPMLSFTHVLNVKHVLSHQIIHADFYRVVSSQPLKEEGVENILEISQEALQDFPVSRLVHKYLEFIQ